MVEDVLDCELELAAGKSGECDGRSEHELGGGGGDLAAGRADPGVGEVHAIALEDDLRALGHLQRGEIEGQRGDGLLPDRCVRASEAKGANGLFSSNCDGEGAFEVRALEAGAFAEAQPETGLCDEGVPRVRWRRACRPW